MGLDHVLREPESLRDLAGGQPVADQAEDLGLAFRKSLRRGVLAGCRPRFRTRQIIEFAAERIERIVLADQGLEIRVQPGWADEVARLAGHNEHPSARIEVDESSRDAVFNRRQHLWQYDFRWHVGDRTTVLSTAWSSDLAIAFLRNES